MRGLVPLLGLAEQTGLPRSSPRRFDHDAADQVRVGEPGTEAGHADRRDVRRRGQHRRPGRAARRWDADPVRRRLRALDPGDAVAGVQLRSRPPTGVGAARAPGRAGRRTELLAGIDEQAFIDIDSLLRPVYGHAKQGASYGHTKIAGKQVLRKGLSPLATTISTPARAPVIAGMRLRAGQDRLGQRRRADGRPGHRHRPRRRRERARSWCAATRPTATARSCGACRRGRAQFSLVMTKNPAIERAIDSIDDDAWTPVRYPGAVQDPDTGAWISDAEVAEVSYTAFASTKDRITARLVVRRVKDARYPDALFPVWRYHPFFTNTDLPTAQADIVHRRHAIIETVFADLIDGPLAHMPSGRFGANSAWALCAAIAHNLLRAAGTLAGDAPRRRPRRDPAPHASSPSPPDWPDPPADRSCTYPATGPGPDTGSHCGTTPSATAHQPPADT